MYALKCDLSGAKKNDANQHKHGGIEWGINMKKKLSASSQPERLVRTTLDAIRKRPLTEKQIEVLRRIADEQARGDDSNIDYADIPETTEEQWAHAVRLRDTRP